MLPTEINHLFSTRPFQPLRITTSSGRVFDISHPNLVFVTKTLIAVCKDLDEESGLPGGTIAWVDPRHIQTVEPIRGNGSNGS